MSIDYSKWNDIFIAQKFTRLITKTNHPYNADALTLEEFNADYTLLKGYIDWRQTNECKRFSLYNFTKNHLNEIFDLIDYDVDNKADLLQLWRTNVLNI